MTSVHIIVDFFDEIIATYVMDDESWQRYQQEWNTLTSHPGPHPNTGARYGSRQEMINAVAAWHTRMDAYRVRMNALRDEYTPGTVIADSGTIFTLWMARVMGITAMPFVNEGI